MTFEEWAESVKGTGILRASCGYEMRAAKAAWDAALASVGKTPIPECSCSLFHACDRCKRWIF